MCDSYLYQEHLNQAGGDCPPKEGYQPINQTIFRIVFEKGHSKAENNFLPVGLIDPIRYKKLKDEFSRCKALGLSFYLTEKQAKRNATLYKNLGTHIAIVMLTTEDGLASFPNDDGHITFHPCTEVKWTINEPLIPISSQL